MTDGSMKIGSIFGIDIELHWILIIMFLLFFYISVVSGQYTLLIILILLFICVFIHELMHAIASQRNGLKVNSMVLTIFGGMTIIEDIRADPRMEFNIALVGPLASIVLGGIFGILVIFTPPGIVTYIFQWLFVLNLLLGVFNLIPIFPMDGARVFRSYLEMTKRSKDPTMATVKVSNYMIVLFIIGTIAYSYLISGSFIEKEFDFFIMLIIDYFFYLATQSEKQNALLRRDTKGMKTRSTLSKHFVVVRPNATIPELYRKVKNERENIIITNLNGHYMVVDLLRSKPLPTHTAADIALPAAELKPDENIIDTLTKVEMSKAGIGVVLERRKILGIVTARQLQTFILLHMTTKKRLRSEGKGFNN
jgi:Zn-dependent protease